MRRVIIIAFILYALMLSAAGAEPNYSEYIAQWENAALFEGEIFLDPFEFSSADNYQYHTEDGKRALAALEGGYVAWIAQAPVSGLYALEIEYKPLRGLGIELERALMVNGAYPFEEAKNLVFPRTFGVEGEWLREDADGNQRAIRLAEKYEWRREYARDAMRYIDAPLLIYLAQGDNEIKLQALGEDMLIAGVRLTAAPIARDYASVSAEYTLSPAKSTIKVQAENAHFRTSASLTPIHDKGDTSSEPYDALRVKLNAIGGYKWTTPGDKISWIIDLPEGGVYALAFKAKQDQERGVRSFRRLYIDGDVPFAQASEIAFEYSQKYKLYALDGLIELSAGRHVITLEATLGDLAETIMNVSDTVYRLSSVYQKVILVTSTNPDPLRTYSLESRVPDLAETLLSCADELDAAAKRVTESLASDGGRHSALTDMARMLRRIEADTDIFARVLSEYRDSVGALGNWINMMRA